MSEEFRGFQTSWSGRYSIFRCSDITLGFKYTMLFLWGNDVTLL